MHVFKHQLYLLKTTQQITSNSVRNYMDYTFYTTNEAENHIEKKLKLTV